MARKKDPEGTKAQILDVALKLFSEKGYEATTMKNIVDMSGLSKGAIYHHFKDKAEIYKGLYEDLSRKPYACFAEIESDASLSAPEKIEAFILNVLDSPEKQIYSQAVSGQKNPDLLELTLRISVQEASLYIARLIEEGIEEGAYPPGDPQMIAEYFCLSIDMWLDPCINENTGAELLDRKLDIITRTFEMLGYPLMTPGIRAAIKHYSLIVY